MVSNYFSLILAIAGLISTSAVATIGLYFTARARSAPMRECLYSKQLGLAQSMFKIFGQIRIFAILLSPESEYRDRARSDMRSLVKSLSTMTDEAAVLFPTDVYVEVKRVGDAITSFVANCDAGKYEKSALDQLASQEAKAALMVRILLGIDELSEESIRLFSKNDSLTKLANISPLDFLAIRRHDKGTTQ